MMRLNEKYQTKSIFYVNVTLTYFDPHLESKGEGKGEGKTGLTQLCSAKNVVVRFFEIRANFQ